MKHRLFRLSNIFLAGGLIAVLAVAAACKTAPAPTTPAASAQPPPSSSSAAASAPPRTFTRTPASPVAPTATSQVPATTPAASPSPTASSPSTTPVAGSSPAASPPIAVSPTPVPAGSPANLFPIVSITSPYYMSTIPAGDVAVNIVISSFNVVANTGQAAAPGQGHIVYYLDVTPPTVSGQPATPAAGLFVDSTATSYTWHNVTSGMHSLSVQLVNNDDTPLSPPVTSTENIIVK